MIFLTVGTDQPFDRMVKIVDAWVAEKARTDFYAQIGAGGWEPKTIPFSNFLSPPDFQKRFIEARIIIAHAGMGTILSALHHGKPILVMPKLASLGEHRNEHQLATARRMLSLGNVNVAFDEAELLERLDQLDTLIPREKIAPVASGPLIDGVRSFIFDTKAK
jgi:UDP-N-acetylglucosamine transferase subunit ALG13